jgi:hypothetical protein
MKLRRIRTTLATSALLGGALVGGVVTAGSAAAATTANCSTSGVEESWTYHYVDEAKNVIAIGYIYQYASSVCAKLVAQGSYYGEKKWMGIAIGDNYGDIDADSDYYYDYAGALTVDTIGCSGIAFVMENPAGTEVVNAVEDACPLVYA